MSDKSQLNEYCQKMNLTLPKYTIVNREGLSHCPKFTIECEVYDSNAKELRKTVSITHPSIREAEAHAASKMYHHLAHLSNSDDNEADNTDVSLEDERCDSVTVLIDGDNVHEVLKWIEQNRSQWDTHLFVAKDTIVRQKVKVHRSFSTKRDATDVAMIIYATRYLALLDRTTKLILVSRDKIFDTLVHELDDSRVQLCQTINELKVI